MNISNIIQAEQGLFINILTYLHMYSYIIVIYKYIATINEKRGYEVEREQGRVYGSIWIGERKEGGMI